MPHRNISWLALQKQSQALVGKFARVKTNCLLSGYHGLVKITRAEVYHIGEIGLEAVKPNGSACEMMRYQVSVCRDQGAAAGRFRQEARS
ncbi:MAG: hypothetical protein ACREJ5_17090 [Geminicoccaceae bacterium]